MSVNEKSEKMHKRLEIVLEKKMSYKVCSVHGCTSTSKEQRMFAFPSTQNDEDRRMQWMKACGKEDLFHLPLQKLTKRTICALHFDPFNLLSKKLLTSAIPTRCLPDAIPNNLVKSEDTSEGIEGCNTTKEISSTSDTGNTETPAPSVDHPAVIPPAVKPSIPGPPKVSILKLIKYSKMDITLKQKIRDSIVTLRKALEQSKRRQRNTKERLKKMKQLMQTNVCTFIKSLPAPLHALLSAEMRKRRKLGSQQFTGEKVFVISIQKHTAIYLSCLSYRAQKHFNTRNL